MGFYMFLHYNTKSLPVRTGKIRRRVNRLLQITGRPVVKVYDGYGDPDEIIIMGYVLSNSPRPRVNYRQNIVINFLSLVRLFVITPIKNARVVIEFNGETREQVTDRTGFFRFEWKPLNKLTPGWHKAKVSYIGSVNKVALSSGECEVFIPHDYQYSFISDIDDTFLVSHSANMLKRLHVLFTKNSWSRRSFEGAVHHYQLLAAGNAGVGLPNPFFYVSSSEYNLYDYIREFCRKQKMPRGIFLLSPMKKLHQLLATGQGKHSSKYVRIARILKAYPNHKYVLLGDNSQMDPEIYHAVVRDFPGKIHAVYIRNIRPSKTTFAAKYLNQIIDMGVNGCLFRKSEEAIAHSVKIGLISNDQLKQS